MPKSKCSTSPETFDERCQGCPALLGIDHGIKVLAKGFCHNALVINYLTDEEAGCRKGPVDDITQVVINRDLMRKR